MFALVARQQEARRLKLLKELQYAHKIFYELYYVTGQPYALRRIIYTNNEITEDARTNEVGAKPAPLNLQF
jgi:hypothetical protein